MILSMMKDKYIHVVRVMELMAFYPFMSYSVNVSTIYRIVLAVAETLSLRHPCRQ